MKPRVFLVLVVGVLLAADAKEDIQKEQEKIKGAWKITALESEGASEKEDASLTFGDDKLTVAFKDEKKTAAYKLDPSSQPKSIDIIPDDGPEKGKTIKGIYSLDGDALKLCFASTPKKDRPTEFVTKKDSGSVLMVLKKEKP